MKVTVVAVLIVAVFATLFAVQNSKLLFAPKAATVQTQVILGPEEQVFVGTKDHMPDFPYLTVNTTDGLVGLISVGGVGDPSLSREYKVSNPMSKALGALTPVSGMTRGTRRSDPDYGGLWMTGTYREPNSNVIHGIYHSETHSGTAPPSLDNTIFTASYIRSNDGGKTWFKPNYPSNVIMRGVGNPTTVGGVDPNSLIKVGNDFYLYSFEQTRDMTYRGMSVAKSPVSGIANPNSWKKYYCTPGDSCGFTEPAIGGKITPLQGLNGKSPVAYNTYLRKFIALSGGPLLNEDVFRLKVSTDGINFTNYGQRVDLPTSIGPGWVKVYSNLISVTGKTSETGQSFYWYYVVIKRDPVTQRITDPKRYLMRRLITLPANSGATITPTPTPRLTKTPTPVPTQRSTPTTTPSPSSSGLTNDLYQLYNPRQMTHLYTLSKQDALVAQGAGLISEGICCKLSQTQITATVPLYRVSSPVDIFMETDLAQITHAEENGFKNRTTVGYCYPKNNQPAGTLPLYRLYNQANSDHFYTTSKTERDQLVSRGTWTAEGVVCYVGTK